MPTTKKTTKKASSKKVSGTKSPTKTAKAVAKKTTKKTSTKKSTNKSTTGTPVLVCAPKAKCFWVTDGTILRDLRELEQALSTMEDQVFSHHVTKEKNDFAEWVEHVLEDAACAAALRRSKKPSSARTVVVRHLKFYA